LANHTYANAGSYAAILTVNDGHGGTDTASVAISATAAQTPTFPVTTVLDNFNRADGAVGSNWIDQTSAYTISANALVQSAGDSYIEWNGSSFGSNQEAFVTLSAITSTAPEHNLMLKTQGTTWSSGHIEVCYKATASRVTVNTFTPPSTWQSYGTISGVTFAPGNQFGARALSNGTVQVYKNGVLLGSVSVAGWPYAALGGRIGLSASRATSSRFDDFGGGNYSVVAPPPNVPPIANAVGAPRSGNAPLPVSFSGATSTDANGDSLTYAWTFGDGGSATGRLANHTYANAGSYAAILTVNDGHGGTDTASVAISVAAMNNTPPVANAVGVPRSGIAPLPVSFSGATSTDANGDSLTFAWTFGDGGSATGRLANHTYANAGSYAAILTVNDGHGGTDTASVAISATAAQTPTFPVTTVLDNFNRADGAVGSNWIDQTSAYTISANALVQSAGDSYIEWNGSSFGSNQEAFVTLSAITSTAPEHNLMLKTQGTTWSSGHIEVCYKATASRVTVNTFTPPSTWQSYGTISGVTFAPGNQFGARALSNGTVQVYKNGVLLGSVSVAGWPYAALGGRIGLSASRATSSRFDDFGGGNYSVVAPPPNVPPVANAVGAPRSGNAPLPVSFSGATSTDSNGDSLTFAWTFGDGGGATGRLANHTYANAGSYAAILTVNDGHGGTDTASVAISVGALNTPPVANAVGVPRSGNAPLPVSFSGATSTDANGDSLTFAWTFGDGGSATGRLANHTYANAGSYAAILTVNDGHGGTDTASVAISVAVLNNTPPVANAVGVPRSGIAPLPVSFSGATSTDANGDSLTFAWTFGDGGSATGRLASHTYANAGSYAAILTVNDGRGGTDTASVAISVAPVTPGTFPYTTVLDNFNRANGAVGGSWVDQTTAFTIDANALALSSGDSYIEWNGATFGPDQEAFVTLSVINTSANEHNLMLKTQGTTWSTGHIEVCYKASSSNVSVITFTPPSTWKTFGTISGVTFTPGDQFGARALSTGAVQVYKNGALVGSVSVAGWAYASLGGRIGLSCSRATSSRYDNFGGGNYGAALAVAALPEPDQTAQDLPSPLAESLANGPPQSSIAPPTAVSLSTAFPNPSNGAVSFTLTLPIDDDVSLSIVDIQGREVWSAPARRYGAGRWSLRWDGVTTRGTTHAGIFFARVRVGSQQFLRRFAVVQ
jgi:PKD repeat protein